MARKLTKRDVDAFQFPDGKTSTNGKPLTQAFLWDGGDGGVKGFGVRITPDGKKTYVVQGRVGFKTARLTIGPHGVYTVDQAREQAKEHLRSMRQGDDPRDARRRDEAARVTLREAAEAHIADPRRERPMKHSSAAAIRRHVTTTFKAWKDKPLIEISEEMCRRRFKDHRESGLHGDRKGGAPGQAIQAASVLQAIFNFAMETYKKADGTPLITLNPAAAVLKKRPKLKSRKHRRIHETKIGHVVNYLATTREQAYDRVTLSSVDLAMFLLWTGCRIAEAVKLTDDPKLSEKESLPLLNIKEGWWHLPDPKNRQAVWFPLPKQAVELLQDRPRVRGNPFVFPGKDRGSHIKDPRSLWDKIAKLADQPKFSAHDCRRTYTHLALSQCGIDYFKVELLTGHKIPGVVGQHYFDTEDLRWLAPEQQKIADFLDDAAARARGANVIPMRA